MPISYGGDVITFPNGTTQASAAVAFKNRIINGAMVIDQRNAGASVTPSNNQYIVDRWKINYSGNFTCQQNAGSVTPPVGFTNYLGAVSTGTNSPTGNTTYSFIQTVEGYNVADLGWGTANAKTVTLSFWVRSSATGTFGGALQNSASDRSYPFSYTISSAGTWEQKTITIAGDTSGTWLTTNGAGLVVILCMGGGANYVGTANTWAGADYRTVSGQTNALASTSNYFYATGVQLEVGSSATSFDYRPYGTELALCQRYYEKTYNIDVVPATNTTIGGERFQGSSDAGYNCLGTIKFKVTKRASATMKAYTFGGTADLWNYTRNGADGASTLGFDNANMNGCIVYQAIGAPWVVGGIYGHWTATAEL